MKTQSRHRVIEAPSWLVELGRMQELQLRLMLMLGNQICVRRHRWKYCDTTYGPIVFAKVPLQCKPVLQCDDISRRETEHAWCALCRERAGEANRWEESSACTLQLPAHEAGHGQVCLCG